MSLDTPHGQRDASGSRESDSASLSTLYRRLLGLAVAAFWIVLFVATHIPLPRGLMPGHSDKGVHFFAYAVLAFGVGLWVSLASERRHRLVVVSVILCSYAVIDELTQNFVRGRSADVFDALSDWAGVAAGLLFVQLIVRLASQDGETSKHADESVRQ